MTTDSNFETFILGGKRGLIKCHTIFLCEVEFILAKEKTLSQMIAINFQVYRASYNTFMRESCTWCVGEKLSYHAFKEMEMFWDLIQSWSETVKFFRTYLNISQIYYARCLTVTQPNLFPEKLNFLLYICLLGTCQKIQTWLQYKLSISLKAKCPP